MQSRKAWRLVACFVPPIATVGLAALVSCRDALTTSRTEQIDVHHQAASARVSASAKQARAQAHEKNPHDWVGQAHNRTLDAVRAEMRKPGVLSHNLCGYIADFVMRPERVPSDKRQPSADKDWTATRAGLATVPMCQQIATELRPTSLTLQPLHLSAMQEQSAAMYQLADQIGAAIDAASDSYDFASRLLPIIDATYSLDPTERDVILAAASVGQNSFEYWESQYPAYVEEFRSEYGTCAAQYTELGYSLDQARTQCLNSGTQDALWPNPRFNTAPSARYTSFAFELECNLLLKFRRLIGADFKGALLGALSSIWVPGGIYLGAFRGAAAASFGSFVDSTWDLFWCAMR